MNRRLWRQGVALALLALCGHAQAQSGKLVCQVEPTRAVIGHAVTWQIRAINLPTLPTFHASDFGPGWLLHGQSSSQSSDGRGHNVQTASVTLYPLRSGRLDLPPLTVGTRRCPARALNIATHAAGESPLYVSARFTPTQPVVGQTITLMLDVASGGVLDWQRIVPQADDADVRPLATVDTVARTDGGVAIAVQRHRWALTALRSGAITVRFGLLKARHFGSLEIYPAPELPIAVRPLPAYWHGAGPVGRPRLELDKAPGRLALGATGVLHLTVSGVLMDRESIAQVLASASSSNGIRLYAPQIAREEQAGRTAFPAWTIAWPFRVERSGTVAYPQIRIPYYDPVLGAPQVATASWGEVAVRDPRPLHLMLAVLAMLALVAALALLRMIVCAAGRALCQRRWRRIIERGDATALQVLWQQALTKKDTQGAAALTLRAWFARQHCGGRPIAGNRWEGLLDAIERTRYAGVADSAGEAAPSNAHPVKAH